MKKLISLIGVVALLLSAMTITVSAADGTAGDPIVLTDLSFNPAITIKGGESAYISFTDTTGVAKRQISITSAITEYAITYGDTVQDADEAGFCNLNAIPDENGTYFFSIDNKSTKRGKFFVSFYEILPYIVSTTPLYDGENAVTTLDADHTIFVYEPAELGIYEFSVDAAGAVLSHWNGTTGAVSNMNQETTEGKLEAICSSVGQPLLIGLSNVDSANITITKIGDYEEPDQIEYVEYVNTHTPDSNFKLPEGEFAQVDITKPQTVVLGDDGYYHLDHAKGPILYVDMTAAQFVNLYECYYPTDGLAADRLRGTYLEDGKTMGYEFQPAMKAYADALDEEGFYYLTEDLAQYIRLYGGDQGWFKAEFSPFEAIKNGEYYEDSAWLITAYYLPGSGEAPDDDQNVNDDDKDEDADSNGNTDDDKEDTDTDADSDSDADNKNEDNDDKNESNDKDDNQSEDDNDDPNGEDENEDVDSNDDNQDDADANEDIPDQSPDTGDMSTAGAIAAILFSCAGAFVYRKKQN